MDAAPRLTRTVTLRLAKVAGYHEDKREWTRLAIEGRASYQSLMGAWREGQRAKAAGIGCTCGACAEAAQ